MIESITWARFPRESWPGTVDTNVAAGVVLDSVDVDQPLNTEVQCQPGHSYSVSRRHVAL